jgi:hypothetical protein
MIMCDKYVSRGERGIGQSHLWGKFKLGGMDERKKQEEEGTKERKRLKYIQKRKTRQKIGKKENEENLNLYRPWGKNITSGEEDLFLEVKKPVFRKANPS